MSGGNVKAVGPAGRRRRFPALRSLASRIKARLLHRMDQRHRAIEPPPKAFGKERSAGVRAFDTKHYFLDLVDMGPGPLVITFEHAGTPHKRPNAHRPGWGSHYLRKRGISHLSVKPKEVDWYRRGGLAEMLTRMRKEGVFDRYSHIMTYGASMGGYAALAYSKTAGARTVLAIDPQSTLNSILAPWERRFRKGANEDWNGPRGDAALECGSAKAVYVVVDRRFPQDWKHIARLPKHNLHVLNLPFLQHGTAFQLVKMKVSDMVFDGALNFDLDPQKFRSAIRARRGLERYYERLENHPRVMKSPLFSQIVAKHRAAAGKLI